MHYKHGLATYPKAFKGTVVTTTNGGKICLQFAMTDAKLRVNHDKEDQLLFLNARCALSSPITPQGDSFDFLNVGCQVEIIKDLQVELALAYKEHIKNFPEFREFITGKIIPLLKEVSK